MTTKRLPGTIRQEAIEQAIAFGSSLEEVAAETGYSLNEVKTVWKHMKRLAPRIEEQS